MAITNGEAAKILKTAIFKASDRGSMQINRWFSPLGVTVRNQAVKEFSYLKGFLTKIIMDRASTEPGDSDRLMRLVMQELDEAWRRWSDSNYGCNLLEFAAKLSYYDAAVSVSPNNFIPAATAAFILAVGEENVRAAGLAQSDLESFVQQTYDSLAKNFANKIGAGDVGKQKLIKFMKITLLLLIGNYFFRDALISNIIVCIISCYGFSALMANFKARKFLSVFLIVLTVLISMLISGAFKQMHLDRVRQSTRHKVVLQQQRVNESWTVPVVLFPRK